MPIPPKGSIPGRRPRRASKVSGDVGLGNLLGIGSLLEGLLKGLLKGLGKTIEGVQNLNLEDLEKLVEAKGDEEAKEKINELKKILGEKGIADLFSKGLDLGKLIEFAAKHGGEFSKEFAGGKGVIRTGLRGHILGISLGKDLPLDRREPQETKFKVKRHEPRAQKIEKKPRSEEEMRQPNLDVFDEKDHILIIGEIRGVTKEDIKYELKEKTLRIYTETGRKYEKEIELPSPVTQEVKWSYRNGVLEVTLTKKKSK